MSRTSTTGNSSGSLPATGDSTFIARRLPWLFLLCALPAVVFLSVTMAPFQVADELSHVFRATQVSRGTLVSTRLGGKVDSGLVRYGAPYQKMWFHSEVKQTVALASEVGAIPWTDCDEEAGFANTAQYGPLLYVPQAIGIKVGQMSGLSVAQSVVLARLANALAACLVGFFALAICQHARALLFTVLLLPMTLSEMGSAAQDALIITLSLLAAAIASRLLAESRPARIGEFALFAFIVAATTMARPTQIALALLTPAYFTRSDSLWRRKALIGCVALVPIVYWFNLLRELMSPWPTGVSVSGQLDYLLGNPLALPLAIVDSFGESGKWYLGTVVGNLGWTDTPMPDWYYRTAAVAVGLAFLASPNRRPVLWPALLGIATFVGLFVAQFGALYLTWTPVAKVTVDGFQGRYVLPVLPLLGWMKPACKWWVDRVLGFAWYPVLAFPFVTLAVLPQVIMVRYYGSWQVMGEALKALLWP